jgi:hypothetical protein
MYMLVQPQWLGNVKCDMARNVNPDNLMVQTQYVFLLNKEKEGKFNLSGFLTKILHGASVGYSQFS